MHDYFSSSASGGLNEPWNAYDDGPNHTAPIPKKDKIYKPRNLYREPLASSSYKTKLSKFDTFMFLSAHEADGLISVPLGPALSGFRRLPLSEGHATTQGELSATVNQFYIFGLGQAASSRTSSLKLRGKK
jgi:hypothetical protein